MVDKQGVQWTAHAATYSVMGLVFLIVGAIVDAALLVVLGGVLALVVAWDALRLQMRIPSVTMLVEPRRVPEEGRVHVQLQGHGLDDRHQVHVPLSPGVHLSQGSNVWTPHDGMEYAFVLDAKVRGPQRVGPATIRNWSPTRLWVRDHVLDQESIVEVVPRAEAVKKFGLFSRVVKPMQGRFTVNRPGTGFDFFTLRHYQTGDTMRDVNWKASARKDEELIVNQRQMETHSEILILLDARVVSGVGPAGRTPLDRACRVALGLYADAVASRDTVRFLFYGDGLTQLPPGTTDRVVSMENLLARVGAAGEASAMEAWQDIRTDMKSHGPVIILSSGEGDSSLRGAVADMAGRGHPVTLFSPAPTGAAWEVDVPRRESRKAILDAVRDVGAVVVDWQHNQAVMAEKPTAVGAIA